MQLPNEGRSWTLRPLEVTFEHHYVLNHVDGVVSVAVAFPLVDDAEVVAVAVVVGAVVVL